MPRHIFTLWGIVNFIVLLRRSLYASTYLSKHGYFTNEYTPHWLANLDPQQCGIILSLALVCCLFPRHRVSLIGLFIFNYGWITRVYPAMTGADLILRVMSPLMFLASFKVMEKYAWFLMKVQVSMIYFFVNLSRWGDEYWMSGLFMQYFLDSMYATWPIQISAPLSRILTYATTAVEIFIMIFMWFKYTRRVAFTAGIMLFGGMFVFTNIFTFPVVMVFFCHSLFFNADEIYTVCIRRERLWQSCVSLKETLTRRSTN